MINGKRHQEEVQSNKKEPMPSKYPTKYRIDLHVDDHEIIRQGLKSAFVTEGISEEVIEATNVDDAMKILRIERPQIAIIDLNLGNSEDGMEIIRQGRREKSPTKFIVLTGSSRKDDFFKAREIGAKDEDDTTYSKALATGLPVDQDAAKAFIQVETNNDDAKLNFSISNFFPGSEAIAMVTIKNESTIPVYGVPNGAKFEFGGNTIDYVKYVMQDKSGKIYDQANPIVIKEGESTEVWIKVNMSSSVTALETAKQEGIKAEAAIDWHQFNEPMPSAGK